MIIASCLFRQGGRRQIEILLADGRRLTTLPAGVVFPLPPRP